MNEWNFQTNKIVHTPCNKQAKRFPGTHGKIWCSKCSKPLPDELESISDFMYEEDEIAPWYFYGYN